MTKREAFLKMLAARHAEAAKGPVSKMTAAHKAAHPAPAASHGQAQPSQAQPQPANQPQGKEPVSKNGDPIDVEALVKKLIADGHTEAQARAIAAFIVARQQGH